VFATLCALIGCLDSATLAVEHQLSAIVGFAVSQGSLGSDAVAGVAFHLLAHLAESQPDGFAPFATDALQFALAHLSRGDLTIARDALSLLRAVLANVEQDPSQALALLPPLLQLHESCPPLQELALSTLASAISACGDAAGVIPDDAFRIAWAAARGPHEEAVTAAALSAVGAVLAYAPAKAGDAFGPAIERLLEAAREEDRGIRCEALAALTAIVRANPAAMLEAVPPLCFMVALMALGPAAGDAGDDLNERDASAISLADIVIAGLDLMRKLLKLCPEGCIHTFHDLTRFREWGVISFSDWIRHRSPEIAEHAARAAVPFFTALAQAEADGEFALPELLLEQIRTREDGDAVAACFTALRKLYRRCPTQMAVHLQAVLEAALAGINRALRCQVRAIQSEETKFAYDEFVQPRIHDLLVAAVEAYGVEFPIAPVLEAIAAIAAEISPVEACALIGVLASFIDKGGRLGPEQVAFALTHLGACDFTVQPDPIFFVRVIIRDQPALLQNQIEEIVRFFAQKLQEPVGTARYYWNTVTNVIAAIFDIARSEAFAGAVDLAALIGPILARLPVRGDLQEAVFIWDCLLTLAQAEEALIANHGMELLRVLAETLASPAKWFRVAKVSDEVTANLVGLLLRIGQVVPNWASVVAEFLGHDEVRLARLQARFPPG
jgi:hypothetical protein